MNVSYSEMRRFEGLTYNPEFVPAAGKNYSVQVTSVEAFKAGNSKTAYLEPQLGNDFFIVSKNNWSLWYDELYYFGLKACLFHIK